MMMLGDMQVVDLVGPPPAKLLKALAVIASELHPAFNRVPRIIPDISRRSCVLSSLAVRDFLRKIGFKGVAVAPVFLVIRAFDGDREIHSLGCGDFAAVPSQAVHHHVVDTTKDWSGHMVVLVDGWVVDTTLYQASREQWPELPGMLAAPLVMDERGDMVLVSGTSTKRDDGSEVFVSWWHQPHNRRWKDGDDAKAKERRAPVVRAMLAKFHPWREAA